MKNKFILLTFIAWISCQEKDQFLLDEYSKVDRKFDDCAFSISPRINKRGKMFMKYFAEDSKMYVTSEQAFISQIIITDKITGIEIFRTENLHPHKVESNDKLVSNFEHTCDKCLVDFRKMNRGNQYRIVLLVGSKEIKVEFIVFYSMAGEFEILDKECIRIQRH